MQLLDYYITEKSDNTLLVVGLTQPSQGMCQKPFCLANLLGISPKVLFANKMLT